MKFILLALIIIYFSQSTFAAYEVFTSQQMIEESVERKARAKAIERATKEVTLERIKNLIGDERYEANLSKIKRQVLPLKNRFIPFFKILSSKKTGKAYSFEIEVKVSTQDLRYVLRQKGLFASSQKTGITLPFLEVNDRLSGESYRWWTSAFDGQKGLENLSLAFESELFQGFLDKGLFLLKPQAFSMIHMVPDFLRKSFLTQTEMAQITSLQKGQLYLEGKVDILSSPLRKNAFRIRVQVNCKQAGNGKSVAQVVRSYDTPSGRQKGQLTSDVKKLATVVGKDIASQVFDLWQRGALESQVLKLAVTGNLNHQQLMNFKKSLSRSLAGVQGLRERLFEPGRVTYEIDYNGGVENLKAKLTKMNLAGFVSQVVSTNSEEIILDVKTK